MSTSLPEDKPIVQSFEHDPERTSAAIKFLLLCGGMLTICVLLFSYIRSVMAPQFDRPADMSKSSKVDISKYTAIDIRVLDSKSPIFFVTQMTNDEILNLVEKARSKNLLIRIRGADHESAIYPENVLGVDFSRPNITNTVTGDVAGATEEFERRYVAVLSLTDRSTLGTSVETGK